MRGQLTLEDELGTFTVALKDQPAIQARPMIAELRAQGLGPTAIARRLNVSGVSTPTGRGHWRPETVQRHANPAAWAAWMREYRRRTG